jgi:cysteate synthase
VKGDYADSIAIAEKTSSAANLMSEGGARNIARRDGMGTVMLEAAITMKKLPDIYFQAVGSGTGAISAWEASMRLIGDGRFGARLPELHLSQNHPFTPMVKAWACGRRNISDEDLGDVENDIASVHADVLTNRNPPYSVKGGMYDAMAACGGEMYGVTNAEANEAERLWLGFEDAVPDPAASVALASLIKAAEEGKIDRNRTILLNMTGGGCNLIPKGDMKKLRPSAKVDRNITDDELRRIVHE